MCQRLCALKLKPHQILKERGAKTSGVYFILSGSISVIDFSKSGEAIVLNKSGHGKSVGDPALNNDVLTSCSIQQTSEQTGRVFFLKE